MLHVVDAWWYQTAKKKLDAAGIEPETFWLTARRSTSWATQLYQKCLTLYQLSYATISEMSYALPAELRNYIRNVLSTHTG